MSTLMNHDIVLIYDGIENSVFSSMVLTPIYRKLAQHNSMHITLISFEKTIPDASQCTARITEHPRLRVIFMRRLPFFGRISMLPAQLQLHTYAKRCGTVATIIARGPHASYLAQNILSRLCNKLVLQARGLCAEEYRYVKTRETSPFKKMVHRFIQGRLQWLERAVFGNIQNATTRIEVVSTALASHIMHTYQIPANIITIAHDDHINVPSVTTRNAWKKEIRKLLGIAPSRYVYCYSGSAHLWQCASETVRYMEQRYIHNEKSFFLVLSHETAYFTSLLEQSCIPTDYYQVRSVHPSEVVRYLSAGDAGILLRKKDIVNWVSRPTKLLEYNAAGLEVIHNNTVALLAHQRPTSGSMQLQRSKS